MDHLQALRVFVAVAKTQSFTGGAQALGLSAPSATRAINMLEDALGARLFTRTTRRVRLTEVGRSFAEEVRDILAQLQSAAERPERAMTPSNARNSRGSRLKHPPGGDLVGRFLIRDLIDRRSADIGEIGRNERQYAWREKTQHPADKRPSVFHEVRLRFSVR